MLISILLAGDMLQFGRSGWLAALMSFLHATC